MIWAFVNPTVGKRTLSRFETVTGCPSTASVCFLVIELHRYFFTAADLAKAAVDPLLGQLLLHAVLGKPRVQAGEIHVVKRLVLIEAGENDGLFPGDRVFV